MKIRALLVFALIISCVHMSEEDRLERQHERENRLILAREEFERRKVDCRRSGGMMTIDRHSREIDEHEYKMAKCVTW